MCGWLALDSSFDAGAFDAALATLAQRGPDHRGVWRDGHMQLGHHRLSIQDLSDAASQPMLSDDAPQRYVLAYNGEIYNHDALRRSLAEHGRDLATLRTHSDTELLLCCLIDLGPQATLELLDGIFGFAFYDRVERTLIAARDRLGVKPLFYSTLGSGPSKTSGGFVAASTLHPFWKLPEFPKRLNPRALRDYLAVQSIFAPDSILEGVHALEPGCWLRYRLDDRTLQTHRYWDIPRANAQATPFEELVERTDAALRQSVRRQLVSDVPIGAFLSGGVDSSLMVHYMAEAAGSGRVRTFSVGFKGLGDGYDESDQAHLVAQRYGCEATFFDAEELTAQRLLDAIADLDQPLADPAYLPTLALSAMTRQHVTVAISGDGGDELFGGYPRFLEDEQHFPGGAMTPMWQALRRMHLLPGALWRRSLTGAERVLYHRLRLGPYPAGRKAMRRYVSPALYEAMRPDDTLERWLRQATRWTGTLDSDALMRADLWTYLSDNCLVKTDRASMRHALEVRVPMLDNEVVDLVLPEPASVKLQGGLKAVLIELSRRYLPREVWDRPKHGFSVPLERYFRGPWKRACDELVHDAAAIAPQLDAGAIRRQWQSVQAGRGDRRTMFTLIVLLHWLRTHGCK